MVQDLARELKKLMEKWAALSRGLKIATAAGLFVVVAGALAASILGGEAGSDYQYVFTKLTPEDSAASADALRAAGIPFRVEAAGDAIAVPSSKVHDARLLLAGLGLPRASGVGFELFDKGDLGVSEFTQKVNLQRALEGELARTIASMPQVREARVHITMPKRGLLKSDDLGASAAVMIRLEPGRKLNDRETAGLAHLVSAAVPELRPDRVTIVDENGALVGSAPDSAEGMDRAKGDLERELEARIVTLLEPAVGRSAVIARVTADMDASEEDQTESVYDPERSAVKSDRKRTEQVQSSDGNTSGVVGAAANQPLQPGGNGSDGRTQQKTSNVLDESRTFEVTGTVTRRVKRQPRLVRLSVAVLVDDMPDGKARSEAELQKLAELARKAVGFDEERGDQFEISSAKFMHDDGGADAAPAPTTVETLKSYAPLAAAGAVVLVALVVGATLLLRKKPAKKPESTTSFVIGDAPGSTALEKVAALPPRERARRLVNAEPERAARVLSAWLGIDPDELSIGLSAARGDDVDMDRPREGLDGE